MFPIKKLLIGVFWPQRKLVKDEKKKGRRKGGRKTKSFLLKLAQVLRK